MLRPAGYSTHTCSPRCLVLPQRPPLGWSLSRGQVRVTRGRAYFPPFTSTANLGKLLRVVAVFGAQPDHGVCQLVAENLDGLRTHHAIRDAREGDVTDARRDIGRGDDASPLDEEPSHILARHDDPGGTAAIGVLHSTDAVEVHGGVETAFHSTPGQGDRAAGDTSGDLGQLGLEGITPLLHLEPDALRPTVLDEGELQQLPHHVRRTVQVALVRDEASPQIVVRDDHEVHTGTRAPGLHDTREEGGVGCDPLSNLLFTRVRQRRGSAQDAAMGVNPRKHRVHVIGVDAQLVFGHDPGDPRHAIGSIRPAARIHRIAEDEHANARVARARFVECFGVEQAVSAGDRVEYPVAQRLGDDVGVGSPGFHWNRHHWRSLDAHRLQGSDHELRE